MTMRSGDVRRCIRAMEGYVPGKQPMEGPILSSTPTRTPILPHRGCSRHYGRRLEQISRAVLRPYGAKVAGDGRQLYGCEVDEVIAGNGSDDILTIIFRTFLNAGDVLATPAPSYTLYNPLSAIQDAIFKEIPMGPGYTLPEDLDAHGAKVVIIVNPNAPTGVLHPRAALRAFLERTHSIVVIDEAYADFAGESAIDLLKEFPHLLVVRTFSKAYALAGMRLGLGFARREIVAEMMKVKDSYNLDRWPSSPVTRRCKTRNGCAKLSTIVRTRTWVKTGTRGDGTACAPLTQ